MPKVRAYAAVSPLDPLQAITIERRDLRPHDVLIDIAYCGVCHSDIHAVNGDWGPCRYPLVVGHEIVGTVAQVGDAATRHTVGDRVGVGGMVDSCRECAHCERGLEQHCLRGATFTYGTELPDGTVTQGGYSTQIVVDERFVLRVPSSIPLEAAGPIMCAGVTTWSPLERWSVGPDTHIAVVGLGGLGHMAVKLARARGATVTALSRTLSKRDDALRLGAHDYFATSDETTFARLAGRFDIILNTVSAPLDYGAYASMLRLDGTMINLGAPGDPVPILIFGLSFNRASLTASNIGSIAETQQVLDFCAQHGIAPETEVFPADQIDTAWRRVLDSQVRYRAVIDIASWRMTHQDTTS